MNLLKKDNKLDIKKKDIFKIFRNRKLTKKIFSKIIYIIRIANHNVINFTMKNLYKVIFETRHKILVKKSDKKLIKFNI